MISLQSLLYELQKDWDVLTLIRCWRHLLDFPHRGVRQNRQELDIADPDSPDDDEYPSLADITLEGISSVRNLVSDLAMDVLLYQSAYCDHIAAIVQQECNRILSLFRTRNPSFHGTVSLCGHSLGSAILFDILCQQQNGPGLLDHDSSTEMNKLPLDFECEDLFCLGSPIALFQMLKGKTVAGRSMLRVPRNPFDAEGRPVSASFADLQTGPNSATVSSPKCRQLFNIFHPSDPVSYRIEPLISPAATALKPQALPSVKRSLWTASGQSLSIIGTRVGQQVGTLWTNITSGVASNLLNRSLGLTSESVAPRVPADADSKQDHQSRPSSSPGRGKESDILEGIGEKSMRSSMDQRFETLYHGFRERDRQDYAADLHASEGSEKRHSTSDDHRARRLRTEDVKLRALNSNGRVDYSLQE